MSMKSAVPCRLIPALSTLLFTLSPMSVPAQQSDQLASANERINFSGKLRMLSQRAAAAGCNLGASVDTGKSRQTLTLTGAEFGKILDGLQNGSSDLNINGAEKYDAVLDALQAVNEQWHTFDAAIMRLANNSATTANADLINTQNMALLGSAQNLVKSVLESYSNESTADGGFGRVIDIAGRQRMLTQKMSKEACQIWSGLDSDEKVETLRATMELFESSLIGLRDGTGELIEPPNERIRQRLEMSWEEWSLIKPMLQKALARQPADLDDRKKLARKLDQSLRDLNSVVGLYAIARKERGSVTDNGAAERVNFSGKLRMLSQRVAAAACNYAAGVETELSQAILTNAQAEFVKITQALEFGDADLRIHDQEKRRKTLEALANVHKEWDPTNIAIESLLQGESVDKNLELINELNIPLLSATKVLVSEISGQYSDPSVMTQADAMLVDISGRQRMFTQKMSKESCFIWSGQNAATADLSATMEIFEASLMALRDGLAPAGIRAAPTAEIMYGLDDIWEKWQHVKPTLQKATSGVTADLLLRSDLLQELDTLLADMNAVVRMYTIHGKTGL